FARVPMMVYGINLLLAAVAYYLLQLAVFRSPGGDRLRRALGRDLKGRVSPAIYVLGILLGVLTPWLAFAAYTVVALMWLVPDRRVERFMQHEEAG
ncbi:MAG: TMEM175 family protein, partial [Nocardioidaceae bacterium]